MGEGEEAVSLLHSNRDAYSIIGSVLVHDLFIALLHGYKSAISKNKSLVSIDVSCAFIPLVHQCLEVKDFYFRTILVKVLGNLYGAQTRLFIDLFAGHAKLCSREGVRVR